MLLALSLRTKTKRGQREYGREARRVVACADTRCSDGHATSVHVHTMTYLAGRSSMLHTRKCLSRTGLRSADWWQQSGCGGTSDESTLAGTWPSGRSFRLCAKSNARASPQSACKPPSATLSSTLAQAVSATAGLYQYHCALGTYIARLAHFALRECVLLAQLLPSVPYCLLLLSFILGRKQSFHTVPHALRALVQPPICTDRPPPRTATASQRLMLLTWTLTDMLSR